MAVCSQAMPFGLPARSDPQSLFEMEGFRYCAVFGDKERIAGLLKGGQPADLPDGRDQKRDKNPVAAAALESGSDYQK